MKWNVCYAPHHRQQKCHKKVYIHFSIRIVLCRYVSFRYYQSSVQRVHQRPSITTQPMCVDTPRERKLVSCLFVCLVVWLRFVLFFFSARYTLLYTNITQSLLDCVFDGDDDGDDDVHSRMKVCFWTTLFATHSTICHVSYFRTFSFSLHRHVLR